ncbi:hypothetical protein DINM_003462 [Dirofilaria immitis]|nr:hypothetical protein [Dirofilaria immitis]
MLNATYITSHGEYASVQPANKADAPPPVIIAIDITEGFSRMCRLPAPSVDCQERREDRRLVALVALWDAVGRRGTPYRDRIDHVFYFRKWWKYVIGTDILIVTNDDDDNEHYRGDSDDSDSIGQTLLGATKAILCLSSYTIRPYFYIYGKVVSKTCFHRLVNDHAMSAISSNQMLFDYGPLFRTCSVLSRYFRALEGSRMYAQRYLSPKLTLNIDLWL